MSILKSIDALVLCGGQGSRLRCSVHPSIPKALADVNGTPFIHVLTDRLQCFRKTILLAGYGAEYIRASYGRVYIDMIVDEELNGTGPALRRAIAEQEKFELSDPFLVVNGDTVCEIDYLKMLGTHLSWEPIATVASKDGTHAGAYLISHKIKLVLDSMSGRYDLPDVLKKSWDFGRLHYYQVDNYFDIGTIESLEYFRGYHAGTITTGE